MLTASPVTDCKPAHMVAGSPGLDADAVLLAVAALLAALGKDSHDEAFGLDVGTPVLRVAGTAFGPVVTPAPRAARPPVRCPPIISANNGRALRHCWPAESPRGWLCWGFCPGGNVPLNRRMTGLMSRVRNWLALISTTRPDRSHLLERSQHAE